MIAGSRKLLVLTAALALVAAASPASASPGLDDLPGHWLGIDVLSSRPAWVSGGDALIRVRAAAQVRLDSIRVRRNGVDVTAALHPDGHALTGLVTGLDDGPNTIEASAH